MNRYIILILLLIPSFSFAMGPEVIGHYEIPLDSKNLKEIAKEFEIINKTEKTFEVYVLEEKVNLLNQLEPKAVLINSNIHQAQGQKAIPVYRNYTQVENDLKAFAKKYSHLSSLEIYGKSGEGRNLYALKISSSKNNKTKLLITGATHGDELITTEMLFIMIGEILEGHSKKPRLAKMLEGKDIYFIPVVSPDSFEARERYVRRTNPSRRVDPNRAFPRVDGVENDSADVIDSLISLFNKNKFSGSLDLHAYGKLVMFPWAYTKESLPGSDLSKFEELAQIMAKDNKYKTGQISKILYEAEGSSVDYFYWKYSSLAMAVEIGREKIPHWDKFPAIADEVREMIFTFIEYFN